MFGLHQSFQAFLSLHMTCQKRKSLSLPSHLIQFSSFIKDI